MGRKLDGREWNESPWPVPLPIDQEEQSGKIEEAVAARM
jgi:hypothetical protein